MPRPRKGDLTERQREILRLAAQGLTNHEIAQRLNISLAGIAKHWQLIRRKLGVPTRTAAVLRAVERGIIPWATLVSDQD